MAKTKTDTKKAADSFVIKTDDRPKDELKRLGSIKMPRTPIDEAGPKLAKAIKQAQTKGVAYVRGTLVLFAAPEGESSE